MSRRRRWIVSGALLVLAGGLTALSTWRHWLGCRADGADQLCLALREDTFGLPLWGDASARDSVGTVLVAVAAVILCAAWLLVAGWARSSAARAVVGLVVGLQPLLVAVLAAAQSNAASAWGGLQASGWLTWPAEVLVMPLLLGAGWILDAPARQTARLILLAWGVTSFGSFHHFLDYAGSALLAGTTGASPPGMGYVTALTQMTLGVAVLVLTLTGRPDGRPEGDELTGRDGFTLAA